MSTPFPFLLLFTWLLLLSSEVSTRPQGVSKPDAVAKSVIPDPAIMHQMKEYKIEVIKSRILNEINLSEPPVITAPVHIPQYLLNQLLEEEDKEFTLGEEENLIAYPLNDNTTCHNETSCARHEFELSPGSKSISSMNVWVQRKIKSLPIEVMVCLSSSFLEEEQECEYQEKLFEVKTEKGWSIFELPYELFMRPRNESLFCALEIFGSDMQISGDQKPFIVTNLNPAASEKKRRSTANHANRNCTCCLLDFYVSFQEINWDNFIIAPSGFNAKMCYGLCDHHPNSYHSNYHTILGRIFDYKTTPIENQGLWTPCCGPVKMKPLEIIYLNTTEPIPIENISDYFIHQNMSDMITEKCGCW